MPTWKLNLFVRVVYRRMTGEDRTVEDILAEYPALATEEKAEITAAIVG